MKYESEVLAMLKDIFFEDWMDAQDWEYFLLDLKKQGVIQKLSNDFQKGVDNGYPIKLQISLSKSLLTHIK